MKNPGILVPGLTIEDMLQGVSKTRNSVISRVFRELNLIEQWGSGIKRIMEETRKLELPDIKIVEIGMRLRIIVFLKEQILVKEQVPQQVTQQVKNLLLAVSGEMNRLKIMSLLKLKERNTFSNNYLKPALEANLIEMTQPDSPNSPTQKYKLTEEGLGLLAQIRSESE